MKKSKTPMFAVCNDETINFIKKDQTGKAIFHSIPYDVTTLHTIADCIELAVTYGVDRIWFNFSPEQWEKIPDNFIEATPLLYNIFPKDFEQFFYYEGYKTEGEGYRPTIGVGFLNHLRSDYHVESYHTVKQAFTALYYLETVLDTEIKKSTGNIGQVLIKKHSDTEKLVDCTLPVTPFQKVTGATSPFCRVITEEEASKKYVIHIDKNAMFLAGSTTKLGIGNYTRIQKPAYNKNYAGLWKIKVHGNSIFNGVDLPLPTLNFKVDTEICIYTPTVKLLQDIGYSIEVVEALIWLNSSSVLEAWYNHLTSSYVSLKTNTDTFSNDIAREIAIGAFKGVYTKALSNMSHDMIYENSTTINKPYWYHSIIAESYARMFYNILQFMKLGLKPFMMVTDGLYYCVNEETIETAFPGIRCEMKPGHFKQVYLLPMEDCIDILTSTISYSDKIVKLKQVEQVKRR